MLRCRGSLYFWINSCRTTPEPKSPAASSPVTSRTHAASHPLNARLTLSWHGSLPGNCYGIAPRSHPTLTTRPLAHHPHQQSGRRANWWFAIRRPLLSGARTDASRPRRPMTSRTHHQGAPRCTEHALLEAIAKAPSWAPFQWSRGAFNTDGVWTWSRLMGPNAGAILSSATG